LIPTSGISGQDEAERRATSALLAVMSAVREFGSALLRPLGAPAGTVLTFIEVPFKLGERTVYPDGLAEVSRGTRSWTTLVEVKTGNAELEVQQVENYLEVARELSFDAVLTISNQIAPAPGVHPAAVDRRKVRKVALHHLSWAEVLTIAVQQRVHRGVSDPDQAWILGELIRYLEHPKSGALDFTDMGGSWVSVREAVSAGTLRPNDKGLADVVSHWEQLLRFAALRLGRELGAATHVVLSRRESADPTLRFAAQAESLVNAGVLYGTLRIPGTAAPLDVTADLRTNRVTVSAEVSAPDEGRPATRVNWLVRQLREAPDALRIDAYATGVRGSMSELLRTAREDPTRLIADPKRELRSFRITAASSLGSKRGTGRGSFIDSVLAGIDGFYEAVLQQLRPWTAKAPQLPKGGRTAAEEAGLDITPPPHDLEEEAVPSELTTSPDSAPAAEVAEALGLLDATSLGPEEDEAVAPQVTEIEESSQGGSAEPTDETPWRKQIDEDHEPELTVWGAAEERLDRERAGAATPTAESSSATP
jgi:hypothetical protein